MTAELHQIGTNLFSQEAATIQISPGSEIDFSKVCRTCLRQSEENELSNEALFIITGKLARLFEMFEASTGLELPSDDKLPRHICDACLQSVKSSYSFRCQSQRANQILQSVLSVLKANAEDEAAEKQNSFKIEVVDADEKLWEEQESHDENLSFSEEKSQEDLDKVTVETIEEEQTHPQIITYEELAEDEEGLRQIDIFDDEDAQIMMEIEQLDEVSERDESLERVRIQRNNSVTFQCDFCGLAFPLQRDLIQHYRDKHPDEKPFKCEICLVSFVHIQSMRRHKKTHTACPKQKICVLCKRSFSRSDDLTRHMRTHTDERPYACLLCQKAFKQHTELKDHMLSHYAVKMYKCEPCRKEWRSRNGWYLHMKAHQDGRNGQRKQRVRKFA